MPSTTRQTYSPITAKFWDTQGHFPGPFYTSESVDNFGFGGRVTAFNLKSWVNTPGYRRLISTGQRLPDNDYSVEFRKSSGNSPAGFTENSSNATYYVNIIGVYSGPVMVHYHMPLESIGLNEVNSRLISGMKGHQWNAPIFIAEAKKTTAMVYQRARHLALMANCLRRGDVVRFFSMFHPSVKHPGPNSRKVKRFHKDFAEDPTKTASNTWLEGSYGWIPFMSDVRSAVNTLMDTIEVPQRRKASVSSSFGRDWKASFADEVIFNDSTRRLTVLGTRTTTEVHTIRATWHFEPNALDLPARFGLVNPLEVIYELVPFSFVADWFIPIGSYLSSLDVPFRVKHLGGTYTKKIKTMSTISQSRSNSSRTSVWGFNGWGERTVLTRSKMLGSPQIKLTELSVSFDLSTRQITSGIALLRQQLLRLGR